MEYRRLGKSGLQVSALSFGSWLTFGKQVDSNTAEACMKLGIAMHFYLICGFPTETEEEAMMTLNFILEMKWLHLWSIKGK